MTVGSRSVIHGVLEVSGMKDCKAKNSAQLGKLKTAVCTVLQLRIRLCKILQNSVMLVFS